MNNNLLTRLFAVLSAQYGVKWTSLIQNEDAENAMRNTWGETLMDIDPVVIKIVLNRLPTEYPNWPPTVGQFLALCKAGNDPTMQQTLPKPRGDEKIAMDALAEMKRIVGVK